MTAAELTPRYTDANTSPVTRQDTGEYATVELAQLGTPHLTYPYTPPRRVTEDLGNTDTKEIPS